MKTLTFAAILLTILVRLSFGDSARHYYIGIIEIEWNYDTSTEVPLPRLSNVVKPVEAVNTEHNHHHEHHDHHHHHKRAANSNNTFIKAVYRLFTDATFSTPLEHPREMGLVGPMILASPGDRIHIHCKNFARFDFNIHPHLVSFDPDEGPGVKANGGEYQYEWHVRENDGPKSTEEPCILGAYHSGLSSLSAEIEAGLVGPIVICNRDVAPGKLNDYRLKTGELLAFAIAKTFNERDSIYKILNQVDLRPQFLYPSINGITSSGSRHSSISLLQQLTCSNVNDVPAVYINAFSIGGSSDFHLLSTSCGLMMTNGRSLTDTLSLYSAGFRTVSFQTSEIVDFIASGDARCDLQSEDRKLANTGMSVSLYPPDLHHCVEASKTNNSLESQLKTENHNLAVQVVDWNYLGSNKHSEGKCSSYKKLVFTDGKAPSTGSGLVGPTLWAAVSEKFEVTLNIPNDILPDSAQGASLELKMPNIVKVLSRSVTTAEGSTTIRYSYVVKPSRIGTDYDSPCRPFTYSAERSLSSAVPHSASFDSGLFGPIIICSDIHSLQLAKTRKNLMLAPIVIDETLSWLAPANKQCLSSGTTQIYHTVNGLVDEAADFGLIGREDSVWWYTLAFPPLPGRPIIFQHTITFSDEGRRNPVYLESGTRRLLIPGSTVVLHGSGQVVVMEINGATTGRATGKLGMEKWVVYCQLTGHHGKGMRASFLTDGNYWKGDIDEIIEGQQMERYEIMAKEVEWDYKGKVSSEGHDHSMAHHHHGGPVDPVLASRRHVYRKLLFRPGHSESYIDSDAHLTLLGPVVILTPESPVEVVFNNTANKPVAINPGAGVISTLVSGEARMDGCVAPGKTATFVWRLPTNWQFAHRPSRYFPECVATLYTSNHDKTGDLYAGLIGPLLICPNRQPSPNVRRLFSLYARLDESRSSLAAENQLTKAELGAASRPFIFDTVNGRLNGVLDEPGFAIYANESVDWFMFSVGDYSDIHTVHYHGSAFGYIDFSSRDTPRVVDTVTVFPGQSITGLAVAGRMQPIAPGVWPIHCHVLEHANRGMMAQYTVYDYEFKQSLEEHHHHHHHHFHPLILTWLPFSPFFFQCLPYCFIFVLLLIGLRLRNGRLNFTIPLLTRRYVFRFVDFFTGGRRFGRRSYPVISKKPPVIASKN